LEYTRASESPTVFHFWTGVSVLAGALRRRVWRDELNFKWRPNFYIIMVAPAGIVSKSTTMNLGMDLLAKVEGIRFGPDSGSWQGLGDAMAEATEYFKYTNGTGEEQMIPMSPVTVAASELGTFLRPDDEGAVSFITDVWDGRERPYSHKTKHSGKIEILGPFLNLIGATTPSWLKRNFPENLIGEGLTSRIVFVYGDRKRHLVSLPSRQIHKRDFYEMQTKLTEDLQQIAQMVGAYEFTDEVYREGGWMDTWYDTLSKIRPIHMASERYSGYLSRKQGHLVKLAIVLAASKREELSITREDLEEADAILLDSEKAMLQVFESIGIVDEAKHVGTLVTYVRAYNWLTRAELYKLCWNIMSERDFLQAIRLAVDGGLLQVVKKDGALGLGPTIRTTH
jgi:hypothetical protein